jgi:hypothetical protein
MLAFARRPPGQHIETLSSDEIVQADLLWPSWYKIKALARTLRARCFLTFLEVELMLWEHMPTEAP